MGGPADQRAAGNATAAAVNTTPQLPSVGGDLNAYPLADVPEDAEDSIIAEAPPQAACSSPLKLDDLQPDVLYHVLLFLQQRDVAHMKMCSVRLRTTTLHACQHWAPKVECWLSADPNNIALLRRLRDLDAATLQQANGQPQQLQQHSSMAVPTHHVQQLAAQQLDDSAALRLPHHGSSTADPMPDQQLVEHQRNTDLRQQGHSTSSSLPPQAAQAPTVQAVQAPKMLDWRQVWCCIERAQQGPWQLDVQALAPSVSPNGVLLTFELLLQQPAPLAEASSCEQHAVGWRDSVTILSFVLDRKTVEIVVDASGRVTSPQRDWCQGCIQLQPGQPRLLALEVSYLFPVPAWFLHPCTLAAPRITSSSSSTCSSCGGSCASSVSGMVLDQTWDSYSSAATSSSMSISQSAALCSALGRADSGSLATSSLSSSGSLGNCVAMGSCNSSSSGGISSSCAASGRPRLSLDLSVGFGSYVIDPRYLDDGPPNLIHRGLERIELSSRVCWRPSKVQSWLGRLLPGIRGHSSSSSGSSNSSSGSGTATAAGIASSNASGGAAGGGSTAAACTGSGSGLKQGARPSFSVSLSKAAAWQVPSDTDRRFAEGFMFWAVQHKLQQLLLQQNVLPACSPAGTDAMEVATGAELLPIASQHFC